MVPASVGSLSQRPPWDWFATRPVTMAREASRFEEAVRCHLATIWRVLCRSGVDPTEAEDVAQEVFWVLARRIADVTVGAERAFLIGTAVRMAADRRRAQKRRPAFQELSLEISTDPAPDELMDLRQAWRILDNIMESFSQEQREVFILVEVEQLSMPEAASVLSIPVGTVASRLRKARELLDAGVRRARLRAQDGIRE